MMVKVTLRNGDNIYGRIVEENSTSIILVAQRELIPEIRISHIRCSKDIGENIVIDRSQVVETKEVSYDEMEFVGEPETEWAFWLGFREYLTDGQIEPEITQYDEGPVPNAVEEEMVDEELEEELDDGIDF